MQLNINHTKTNEIQTITDVDSFEVGANAIYVYHTDQTETTIENATVAGGN